MVVLAFKILHCLYAHSQYKPQPPNTSANIEFIKLVSTKVVEGKEAIDYLLHDIVFWNDPQSSTVAVVGLFAGAFIVYIGFKLIRVRVVLTLAVWGAVLGQYQFFQDIGAVVYKSVIQINIQPLEQYIYKNSEQLYLKLLLQSRKMAIAYQKYTCKRQRQYFKLSSRIELIEPAN